MNRRITARKAHNRLVIEAKGSRLCLFACSCDSYTLAVGRPGHGKPYPQRHYQV